MSESIVRYAALVMYAVSAFLPVSMLVAHRQGVVVLANSLSLATLVLFGASLIAYPLTAAWLLAIVATLGAVSALATSAQALLAGLRDVQKTPAVTYLLVILPAVLVAIVAESILWESERSNLIRLVVIGLCTVATWGGIRRWSRLPALPVRLLIGLTAGLTLALVAETLRATGVARYALPAELLIGVGGRFLAYFGAAMCLCLLPGAARRELSGRGR
jgi:hypothetical protein